MQTEDLDIGQWAEGNVEVDPMTGRMVVRMLDEQGRTTGYVDPQAVLEKYKGERVRIIICPFSTIERMHQLVEAGQMTVEQASYHPPKTA